MSGSGNKSNFFRKLVFKFKNFSSKFDNLLLGPDFKSKHSKKGSDLENIIIPEHVESGGHDDFPEHFESGDYNHLDNLNSNQDESDSEEKLYEEYLNNLEKQDFNNQLNDFDDEYLGGDSNRVAVGSGDYLGGDSNRVAVGGSTLDTGDNDYKRQLEEYRQSRELLDDENAYWNRRDLINHSADSLGTVDDKNAKDYNRSDGYLNDNGEYYPDDSFNDDKVDANSKFNFKNSIDKFKQNLLNKNDKSKDRFGKIAFLLIFLVLFSSAFYFLVYQPFQEQLELERNAKLNELNALYKGPLEAHSRVFTLKNQIEDENNLERLKSIDVLQYATVDWREYHKSKISSSKDSFGRVMLSYYDNETKNVIMTMDDANDFVDENDAKILSNLQFKKVDTVIVPISLSRLQATAGLISVGSIVDIYSLANESVNYDDESISTDSSLNSSNESENSTDLNESDDSSDLSSDASDLNSDSNLDTEKGPDVSGATVLAILRSKDSGLVDSSFSKSSNRVNGNETIPTEDTKSFSTDVEELLKASVFGNYSGNYALQSYLDDYGVKLSDYERMSNIGELDSEYIILLEVPRSDVDFVINNMDSLILTIPTQNAPNWVVTELNNTYYTQTTTVNNFSFI